MPITALPQYYFKTDKVLVYRLSSRRVDGLYDNCYQLRVRQNWILQYDLLLFKIYGLLRFLQIDALQQSVDEL